MLHTHVQEVGTLCRDKERVKSVACWRQLVRVYVEAHVPEYLCNSASVRAVGENCVNSVQRGISVCKAVHGVLQTAVVLLHYWGSHISLLHLRKSYSA